MNARILSAIALFAISFNAMSHNAPYWVNSSGNYVRSSTGGCIRTISWTPETAVPECEGGVAKAATRKPEPAPAAPATTTPEPEETVAEVAAPKYRNLNLASSATFALGGSTLSASGKAAVAALLAEFKGEEIESVIVEGHTDDRGDAAFNQRLSEKRAEAVKAELVANGVDGTVIKTIGRGESMPIADNNTREGRAKNRRVEIKVDARKQEDF
jgi:OOP family OmpA-OmpF porin